MSNIRLSWDETTTPDLSGFNFYVEAGRAFDADDYAEAYSLNRHDLDVDDVHAVQDAASRLTPGAWLHVAHK